MFQWITGTNGQAATTVMVFFALIIFMFWAFAWSGSSGSFQGSSSATDDGEYTPKHLVVEAKKYNRKSLETPDDWEAPGNIPLVNSNNLLQMPGQLMSRMFMGRRM
jgi:hypothetical protein